MRTELSASYAEPQRNLVLLDGEVLRTERFKGELIEGFSETYRFIARRRTELARPDGPLHWLGQVDTRFVFRPSNIYATVIDHLQSPKYQRTGWSQGLLIESMNRVLRGDQRRPRPWPLVTAERRSLERLDIPHFTVPSDARDLDPGTGETILGFFARSGIEVVRDRLEGMNEIDLERQVGILERVLWSPDPAPEDGDRQRSGSSPEAIDAADGSAIPEALRNPAVLAAQWIADQLREAAIQREDGSPGWSPGDPDDPFARWYLYDGDLGVALFFAALARITGATRFRETALSTAAVIGPLLADGRVWKHRRDIALGACNGLGGLIYPLACVGRLLDEDDLLKWALQIADQVSDERIAADDRHDVEGGSAGAILSLLALYQLTGEERLIGHAARCGDHLVARGRETAGGGIAWPDRDGLMLAGLAHGAAGIAYSLTRLFESTRRRDFRDTALAALRYERSLFDAAEGNWPVLVPPASNDGQERIFMSTWCHGAPGIALARLGIANSLEDGEIQHEIQLALDTTQRVGVGQVDHFCCGNMGRVEALLTAGQLVTNVGHMRAAGLRSVIVLQRAYDRGFFGLYPVGTDGPPSAPGFFQGLSGIGYQLLRLSYPDQLPSVGLFQPDIEHSKRGRCE
jgi:type 2 lantibiotic biosynthesis protein LanM